MPSLSAALYPQRETMNDLTNPISPIDAFWRRTNLAQWMRAHREDIADYIASGEADWQRMALVFGNRRIFLGLGDLPTPALLQDTWRQVDDGLAA